MATLEEKVAVRLERRLFSQLNWARVAGAVQALSAAEKAKLVLAVEGGNAEKIGRVIISAVLENIRDEAASQAATMLADGGLSAEELESVL